MGLKQLEGSFVEALKLKCVLFINNHAKAVYCTYYFSIRLTKSSFLTYLPSLNCGYF